MRPLTTDRLDFKSTERRHRLPRGDARRKDGRDGKVPGYRFYPTSAGARSPRKRRDRSRRAHPALAPSRMRGMDGNGRH
jgi:hypothetical protein